MGRLQDINDFTLIFGGRVVTVLQSLDCGIADFICVCSGKSNHDYAEHMVFFYMLCTNKFDIFALRIIDCHYSLRILPSIVFHELGFTQTSLNILYPVYDSVIHCSIKNLKTCALHLVKTHPFFCHLLRYVNFGQSFTKWVPLKMEKCHFFK